jgi:hypothetical protein
MIDMSAKPAVAIVELAYDGNISKRMLSHKISSPKGNCVAFLENGPDTAGNIVQLQLGLSCPRIAGKEDLLERSAPQPGYQPFMFAASDMTKGAEKSEFGGARVIRLPQAKMSIRVKIDSVQVSKIDAPVDDELGYKFEALHILVTCEPLVKNGDRPFASRSEGRR